MLSQILSNATHPTFHQKHALGPKGSSSGERTHKCCVYIAESSKYCARLNSIQLYSDINRDVSSFSWQNFLFRILLNGSSGCSLLP